MDDLVNEPDLYENMVDIDVKLTYISESFRIQTKQSHKVRVNNWENELKFAHLQCKTKNEEVKNGLINSKITKAVKSIEANNFGRSC